MKDVRLDAGARPYPDLDYLANIAPHWWRIARWAAPVSSLQMRAIEGRFLANLVLTVAPPDLTPAQRLERASRWLGNPRGLDPRIDRETGQIHYDPCLARLSDPSWLRRVARRQWRRDRSHRQRIAHPTKTEWCTSVDAAMHSEDQARHAGMTETMEMVASDGATCRIPSRDKSDKARYAQLLAICKGIAEISRDAGLQPALVTITLPSQWHSVTTARGGRRPNPAWNKSSPSKANKVLQRQWARFRSAISRRGIRNEWVRAVQAHKDCSPHWHLVMWASPNAWPMISELMRRYFVDDLPDDTGATTDHRLEIKSIQGGHAGAVAYLSRTIAYIGRATVGVGCNVDSNKKDAAEAEATAAWASTNSIRRFSTSLTRATVWRMLRRADVRVPPELQEAQEAAREGRYADFHRASVGCSPAYEAATSRHGDATHRLIGVRFAKRTGAPETVIRPSTRWIMRRRAVPASRAANAAPWSFPTTVRKHEREASKFVQIRSLPIANVLRHDETGTESVRVRAPPH